MPIYVGTNKIKSIYHGTTKIKSIYVGSTKVYSTGIKKYGMATNMTVSRSDLAATYNPSYVLFGGGYRDYDNKQTNIVDAYSSTLVRSSATTMQARVDGHAAASVGNYGLFAGGTDYTKSETHLGSAYNTSLSRTNISIVGAREYVVGGQAPNYAYVAGGQLSNNSKVNAVDAFNSSLVRSVAPTLYDRLYGVSSTGIGNYCLFLGGVGNGGNTNYARSYNHQMVASNLSSLPSNCGNSIGAKTTTYGILYNSISNELYAYDSSLVRTVINNALPVITSSTAQGSIEDYFIVASGARNGNVATNAVYTFDSTLVRTLLTSLTDAKHRARAGGIGNYLLVAGGQKIDTTTFDNVDVYEME